MAVTVDLPLGLVEEGEPSNRQRRQRRPFHFLEGLLHLLAGGAVDAGVGHLRLPLQQMSILLGETGEGSALQGVALNVAHVALDLALVARGPGSGRQDHRAVVRAKRLDLRIQLRVVPVGLGHRGLEVVDDQRLRDAAEVMEGVLQATDEVLGGLAVGRLRIRLAGVTERDAEDVSPPPSALGRDDRGTAAKVDLRLLSRGALQTAERQGQARP